MTGYFVLTKGDASLARSGRPLVKILAEVGYMSVQQQAKQNIEHVWTLGQADVPAGRVEEKDLY